MNERGSVDGMSNTNRITVNGREYPIYETMKDRSTFYAVDIEGTNGRTRTLRTAKLGGINDLGYLARTAKTVIDAIDYARFKRARATLAELIAATAGADDFDQCRELLEPAAADAGIELINNGRPTSNPNPAPGQAVITSRHEILLCYRDSHGTQITSDYIH